MFGRVLLALSALFLCCGAFAQTVNFDLLLNGKAIGKGAVTVKKVKQGLQAGSHFSYGLAGFDGRFDNDYRLNENYAPVQVSAMNLNTNTHYFATLDKGRTQLNVTTMQNGEQSSQPYPVRPDLELMPTFDAAGAQLLLLRAVAHPTADNRYNVVVPSFGEPQGTRGGANGAAGTSSAAIADQLPSSRQSYDAVWSKATDVHGALDGKPVTAHSYTLVFGTFRWIFVGDEENNLLQMNVSASQPNYIRHGFILDAKDAAALDAKP